MAFYPLSQYDFPNTSNYDSDLREVLRLVKELYEQYNTMYNGFLELDDRFKNYITPQFESFKRRMDGLTSEIESAVKVAVDVQMIIVNKKVDDSIIELNHALKKAIDEMKRYESELKRLFDKKSADIDRQFSELSTSFTNDFNDMRRELYERFTWFEKRTNMSIDIVSRKDRAFTKMLIQDLRDYVDELFNGISLLIPPVYNPITGMYGDIDKTLMDVWNSDRYGGANAWEMTVYAPTCDTWEEWNLTAYQLAQVFRWYLRNPFWAWNPLSGKREPLNYIVRDMSHELNKDCITVADFMQLVNDYELTVEDFDTWSNGEYYMGNGIPCRQFFLHSFGILHNEPNLTPTYIRYMFNFLNDKIEGMSGNGALSTIDKYSIRGIMP